MRKTREKKLLPRQFWHEKRIFFGLALILLALTCAVISFVILIGITSIVPNRALTMTLIAVNGLMVLGLSLLIARELYPLIAARRAGRAASKLHIRIITLFSAAATMPALIIAIVASITLNLGLDRWFDTNTRQIVGSSVSLANAYSSATLQSLQATSYTMAAQLDDPRLLRLNPSQYRRQLTLHAVGRGLRGILLLNEQGQILLTSERGGEANLPIPPIEWIKEASETHPVQFQPGDHDYFGVILKIPNIEHVWLYVVRDIDPAVLEALRLTELNTNNYRDMEANRVPAQIAFATLYLCLVLIMLLSAIWTALAVADKLVRPIRLLINAADDVTAGNMDVVVPVRSRDGDIGQLARTFNSMVRELKNQHGELIELHNMSDERRRFTETVLSGVSAAVIGVDANALITITNRPAHTMFGFQPATSVGKNLSDLSPEIGQIFEVARSTHKKQHREQLIIARDGHTHVYKVQITMEDSAAQKHFFVVSIDDITDLIEAQRSAAWADIARRIAHEIKNPLTPIQLSAERIRRRYGKVIKEGRDVFEQCIETIIRQVGDIGRMVDEFSSFARMPKPNLAIIDIRPVLKEACFLIEVSRQDIRFSCDFSHLPLMGTFDNRLIGQAFINVIKNASEAIDSRMASQKNLSTEEVGKILVKAYPQNEMIIIDIIDNGIGLPTERRQQLVEPYITTREKGTGLGLAIVRKIIEEHGATLELHDAPLSFAQRGAMIRMIFSRAASEKCEAVFG